MRVLVCGGRDYGDWTSAMSFLDWVNSETPITMVIHGGAQGADAFGAEWADRNGVPTWVFPADWKAHGRKAGPLRNQQMLDEALPERVIAFPGGRGTADMLRRAGKACVRIMRVGQ